MKISKIKIKNLFGITESELSGSSVEIKGKNGVGKTSVIDAIRYALTNKSDRDYIVKNGETEGEIIIETDADLSIRRKPRTNQVDYKSIKKNGAEVQSPESFLRDIFTELQLSPIEFISWDKNKQNATILNMIQCDWSLQTIKEWFGEIPPDVNYEQNILQVLNDIQKEDGYYFRTRQDINREARNKKAFIEEIAENIPMGYQAEKWESADLSELYTQIERIRKDNQTIEEAKRIIDNKDNKIRKFEADKEIAISVLDREVSAKNTSLEKDILKLQEQIKAYQVELNTLEEKKKDKLAVIESNYKAQVASYEKEVEQYEEYVGLEIKDITELLDEAKTTEEMKAHLNEYYRMKNLQDNVEELVSKSEELTAKIEKARTLPGIILQTATIPIQGLSVKDGIPLINGLPVSNLSEGEKLDLCIDVVVQKPGALRIVLIDGIEKLSSTNRERLYAKCKDKGLQFIATRTTDDSELIVTEL